MTESSEVPSALETLVGHPSVVEIGRIHELILKADRLVTLWDLGLRDAPAASTSWPTFDQNENFVAFWIARCERNVADLLAHSQEILPDFVTMKRDSRELALVNPGTYESAGATLKAFCDTHQPQVERIFRYVEWLGNGDPVRPDILFTYAKWGSTRRMERSPPDEYEGETRVPGRATLRQATEFAMGVRIFDSVVSDRYDESKAASRMLSEFADYWDRLRMSVEEIAIQCTSRRRLEALMTQADFWESFVRDTAMAAPLENELWDIKETLDYWHCGADARAAKEIEFVERIASFANARGGVIIVGVTNGRPREVVGVPDCERRVTMIHRLIPSRSSMDANSLKIIAFDFTGPGTNSKTCIAVCVAQTPHAVEVQQTNNTMAYPIRRGPTTVRVSREEIEAEKRGARVAASNFSFLNQLATPAH